MNYFRGASVLAMIAGALLFAAGTYLYWRGATAGTLATWAGIFIVVSLLVMVGAIFLLSISYEYSEAPEETTEVGYTETPAELPLNP